MKPGNIHRLARGLVLLAALVLSGWVSAQFLLNDDETESIVDLLDTARTAFHEDRLDDAEEAVRHALDRRPDLDSAWLLLGQVYEAQGKFEDAVHAYDQVSGSSTDNRFEANIAAGAVCLNQLMRLSDAERYYAAAYKMRPTDLRAAQSLARVYGICGRSREQAPILLQLIRLDDFSNFHLYALVAGSELKIESESIAAFCASDATDTEAQIASARIDVLEQKIPSARSKLEDIVRRTADSGAIAMLGLTLLADHASDAELAEWSQQAVGAADGEPDIWRVLGENERRIGNAESAIRCFAESLRLAPTQSDVAFQLGQLLEQSGQQDTASTFLEWARGLQTYRSMIEVANSQGNISAITHVVDQAAKLGLAWEAYGWCRMALRRDPGNAWARNSLASLRHSAESVGMVRVATDRDPAQEFDLSNFPVPSFPTLAQHNSAEKPPAGNVAAGIRFHEEASERGIHFRYQNGADIETDGLRHMYEFTGGGVAVLDHDLDTHFHSLYFSREEQPSAGPEILRYAVPQPDEGNRFADVTSSSRA